MTAHIGRRIAKKLIGDELFSFEYGPESQISARDLKSYVGGDIAVPAFRLEAGASAQKISDLPNAEGFMNGGDIITGLQNGVNVNFSAAQIIGPLVDIIKELLIRCENIENLLKEHGLEPKE